MNKAAALAFIAILAASSLVGAVALGIQSSNHGGRNELLAPIKFQLNGRDPYVIELPLSQGERIVCDVNASVGEVTLLLTFKGLVLWSSSFSGQNQRQIRASYGGTYLLTFESSSPARVWLRLSSG
jgi:hypothetical protein